MEHTGTLRYAGLVANGFVTTGTQTALGNLTTFEVVKVGAHFVEVIGRHEFQHGGVTDVFTGMVLGVFFQVVVRHHDRERCQSGAFGTLEYRFVHTFNKLADHMRMQGTDHRVFGHDLFTID